MIKYLLYTGIVGAMFSVSTLDVSAGEQLNDVSNEIIVDDVVLNGWVYDSNVWSFYKDGTVQSGWNKIAGKWYYMNTNGAMHTGWKQLGRTWYYMDTSGVMQSGWNKIAGKWYYMNSNGAMHTGWKQLGKTWYYMNSGGVMQSGWNKIAGKWYYMNTNGAMHTGWKQIGRTWYYMNPSGVMHTGWKKLGKDWYYLKASGAMQTDWLTVGETIYTFDARGVNVSAVKKTHWAANPFDFTILDHDLFNEEYLNLINKERKKLGVKPLEYYKGIQKGTDIRAKEVAIRHGHIRPDGSSWDTVLDQKYLARSRGENVASTSFRRMSYEDVISGKITLEKLYADSLYEIFYYSPGHYANMTSQAFDYITLGLYDGDGRGNSLYHSMLLMSNGVLTDFDLE